MSARRPKPSSSEPEGDEENLDGARSTGTDQVAMPGPPPEDFDDADPELAERLKGRSAAEIYGDDEDSEVSKPEGSRVAPRPRNKLPTAKNPNATRVAEVQDDAEPDDGGPDATHAGPPVKLEIVAGPDEGNVKRFKGVRMVIGRVKGCDLLLSDASVSRRHLELIVSENGVLLRDLGSGNGTKVNGERVTERKLEHEDVIALGQTKLRFIDEGAALAMAEKAREAEEQAAREEKEAEDKAAAEAAAAKGGPSLDDAAPPTSPSGRKSAPGAPEQPPTSADALSVAQLPSLWRNPRARIAAGILAALLLVVIGLTLFSRHRPDPAVEQAHKLGEKKLQFAQEAAAENRFKDALDLVAEAEKLGADSHGLGTKILLDAKAQNSLQLAEGEIEQKRYDDARAELTRTPEASERMNALHARLLARLNKEQTEAQAKRVEDALSKRDFVAAEQAIDGLPPELQQTFRQRLEEQKTRADQETKEAQAKDSEARERKREHDKEKREIFVDEAFAPIGKRLGELDWSRAASECDRVAEHFDADREIYERARDIKRRLPILRTNFEDGKLKVEAHSYDAAVRPLRKARDTYKETGLTTPLGHELDDLLMTALLESVKAGMREYDYHGAGANLREAMKINPQDSRARALQQNLSSEADQLLEEAFRDANTDPTASRGRLKLIMEIVPRNSDTYRQARDKLKSMEP